jgi:hypothetical protein
LDTANVSSFTAISKVEVARLLPGDVLVVTVREGVYLSQADAESLRSQLRAALPIWVKVAIAQGVDFMIVRRGDGGETSKTNTTEGIDGQPREAQPEQE